MADDRRYWQPEIETMSRADLGALQAKRLRAQVEWVAASPFYRRHWGTDAVPPDQIRTPADVRRLPFLQKQTVLEAQLREPPTGDLPTCPAEEWREVYPVKTAGGTAYTVYADEDLVRTAEIGARILWSVGLRPGEMIHNGFSYGLFAGGIFLHRAVRALGGALVPIGTDSVQRQVEMLFNFKPAMLVGAPSHLAYLAERVRERGLSPRDIGLKAGLFGGEPGAGGVDTRNRLEQLFGCPAYDLYGITEVSTLLAGECPLQNGLHWAEDHVLVEVIDPGTREPCRPGERGVLVLTDLTRRNMPLLRYWTGDMVTLVDEPCPCGRTHARSVGGIRGRTDELVLYRGARFYPGQVGAILTAYGSLGEEYRIVLERDEGAWQERATVMAEAGPGALIGSGLAERVAQRLTDELGVAMAVEILPYGSLGRSPRHSRRVDDRRVSP